MGGSEGLGSSRQEWGMATITSSGHCWCWEALPTHRIQWFASAGCLGVVAMTEHSAQGGGGGALVPAGSQGQAGWGTEH